MDKDQRLGKYLSLEQFCTCTETYRRFEDSIDPYPRQDETLAALRKLNQAILDPMIDHHGLDGFRLTYGFCSRSLRRYLVKKNPETGRPYGRVDPKTDQHMAHELNTKGNPYCKRLGAACDFRFEGIPSNEIVDWILARRLPFDSLYYYGAGRSIHVSSGPEQKRAVWAFNAANMPTRKGIEHWVEACRRPDQQPG